MILKKILFLIIIFFLFLEIGDCLYCNDTELLVEEITEFQDEDTPLVGETTDFEDAEALPDDENEDTQIDDAEHHFEPTHEEPRKELTYTKDDVLDYIVENRSHVITGRKHYEVPWFNFLQFNNIWLTSINRPIHTSLHKLQNFGRIDNNKFSLENYPYSVALTRMYAGLGEYDKNFAHITFYKDEMLAIDNLNFRGDFRGVSDYQNTPQKFSDSFLHAKYTLYDFSLSMNYLNFDRELNPIYYCFEKNDSYISEVWNVMNFEVTWKNLFISYFSSKNKVSASSFESPLKYNNQSLAAGINLDLGFHNLVISGQHDFNDNLLNLQHRIVTDDYKIKTDGVLYENGSKIYANTDINATLYKNLYFLGKAQYSDIVRPKIYFSIENHIRNSYEGGLGFNSLSRGNFYYNTYLLAGQRAITQYSENMLAEKYYTVSHVFDVNLIVNNFLFNVNNKFDYNNLSNQIYLLSDYYSELNASITWSLKNDNKLILGTRVSLISDIINYNKEIVPMNHCIDAYLSIYITKLFDIKAEINNLTRSGSFGNEYLSDVHFATQMVWYFIN